MLELVRRRRPAVFFAARVEPATHAAHAPDPATSVRATSSAPATNRARAIVPVARRRDLGGCAPTLSSGSLRGARAGRIVYATGRSQPHELAAEVPCRPVRSRRSQEGKLKWTASARRTAALRRRKPARRCEQTGDGWRDAAWANAGPPVPGTRGARQARRVQASPSSAIQIVPAAMSSPAGGVKSVRLADDRVSEHYPVRSDVELADLGVVGAGARLEDPHRAKEPRFGAHVLQQDDVV